jgi:hypothetical protein
MCRVYNMPAPWGPSAPAGDETIEGHKLKHSR